MIEKIIEFSAKNRFLVLLFTGFLLIGGIWAIKTIPLDAIPDLSDPQVIVFTEWKGRSPDLVEDQITYPIVSNLMSAPKVKTVRGYSFFGLSFVYTLFDEGTDIYWARSRVSEYMQSVQGMLPMGVQPTLGPDATGVGWGFQYALVDETGKHTLQEIRSFQDWYLRYWLQSVEGVAEVASVGGYEKQYQVQLDPNKLLAFNMTDHQVVKKIKENNSDVGGRVLEISGKEYFIRGRGYITEKEQLEEIALGAHADGTPILLRDVAQVEIGPDIRRGAAELDGKGEVVGGIVVVRFGENVLKVIERVKEKIEEVKPGFPDGLKLVPVYDRSELITESIESLRNVLIQEIIIVLLVIMLFLFHFRSALIAVVVLPIAVIIAFLPMKLMGLSSNIMSLGGIAIAIGTMVDAICVLVENAHKRIESAPPNADRLPLIIDSAKDVGRPIFFSLLIITASFLPVFALEAQEGRLFKPLAYTKTFAMFGAAILSITLVPVLMTIFIGKGKIWAEKEHPVSKRIHAFYNPLIKKVFQKQKLVLISTAALILTTLFPLMNLGSEFMPPLNEGSILYMPTTLPGISIEEAKKLLQTQDKILKAFPEVKSVFGKVGRAKTATDPAPLSMIETTITLKPKKEWRKGMTWDKLIEEMDEHMQFPGVTNAWTMPIKGRIDMLTTGIRTPVGIKVFGKTLKEIGHIGEQLEALLDKVPGTRSVFSERVEGGYFVDVTPRREEIARYGLGVQDVHHMVEIAIGGMNIETTVEGRERYPINVRYAREFRDDIDLLKRVLVPTPTGAQIPLSQLADVKISTGPPMIKNEDGGLTGWVYVDVESKDIGGWIAKAKKVVEKELHVPAGANLVWAGQYEFMQRVKEKLKVVLPITFAIIIVMLYLNFHSIPKMLIVLLTVPFALIGSVWYLFFLGYNMSIAVWVGMIALAGLAVETAIVMITFLDQSYEKHKREGKLKTQENLHRALSEGAVGRARPVLMTVITDIIALVPIMFLDGAGMDATRRIAAPMIGGSITAAALTLIVLPVIYGQWKWHFELKKC